MAQNTNTMIKLALVFFISLLSFSIGTYVGKKYSDNQHKLAALEPNKKVEEKNDSHEFASSHNEKTPPTAEETAQGALTDSDVAKLAEEFAADEATEPTASGKTIAVVEAQEREIPVIDSNGSEVKKPAHSVAATNAAPTVKTAPTKTANTSGALPAKTVATSTQSSMSQQAAQQIQQQLNQQNSQQRIPAALNPEAKSLSGAQFTLQVGSFPTPNEAQKLAAELQSKGYKSSFVPALVNGQTWYRVNVGLFGTSKEAIDYKKEFLEKTKMTSAIVQKVQGLKLQSE